MSPHLPLTARRPVAAAFKTLPQTKRPVLKLNAQQVLRGLRAPQQLSLDLQPRLR